METQYGAHSLVEVLKMTETLDINEEIRRVLSNKIDNLISNIDIGTILLERIDQYVESRATSGKLQRGMIEHNRIDWSGYSLPAGQIGNGTIHDFSSDGIEDHATEVNLTVLDGQVVIENETVTKQLTVVDTATVKTLSVGKLTVNDGLVINDGKFAEQIKGLIDSRISQHASENPWDTNGKPLISNRVTLIDNNSLGSSIVESNLRKLGRLVDLNVTGATELAETVYIDNGRLGINTDEPAGVFTAWDEESEITIRKYKQRTMYVGSSRDSEMVLGVSGDAVLAVRKNGIETNSVKIGNITISNANREPTHRGSPGDLVINNATVAGQPWAWRCTGADKWVPLT